MGGTSNVAIVLQLIGFVCVITLGVVGLTKLTISIRSRSHSATLSRSSRTGLAVGASAVAILVVGTAVAWPWLQSLGWEPTQVAGVSLKAPEGWTSVDQSDGAGTQLPAEAVQSMVMLTAAKPTRGFAYVSVRTLDREQLPDVMQLGDPFVTWYLSTYASDGADIVQSTAIMGKPTDQITPQQQDDDRHQEYWVCEFADGQWVTVMLHADPSTWQQDRATWERVIRSIKVQP